ncbi:MerR family transcriptional regulator [Thiorhodococcus fuscus]|uniref:Helix-turn-helix domain-containing protein n=1 Tax=Thiorhodococcus fuscus TaxID=527200 RepID=A0ABW4YAF8_9GAMM
MFGIGDLSRATEVKVPTIRYYEEIGLLPAPVRTASNRRRYPPEAVRRLRFIRHARELGFDIPAIRDLLSLTPDDGPSCHQADAIARAHLEQIDQRIERLSALRDEISHMLDDCASRACDHHCRVLEVLSDHGHCRHREH